MSPDIVCFSHLRWDFVYQRPNHLMARAARDARVFFVEEPTYGPDPLGSLARVERQGVVVLTPQLPAGVDSESSRDILTTLMNQLFEDEQLDAPVLWYYTPMALPWTGHLAASVTVYDSMDYLPGFLGAPSELISLEAELLERADLVFTGGVQLQRRMARLHPAAHCFPSSVDIDHFAIARTRPHDPVDQAPIPRPRIGYAGVIDERLDLPLIADVATQRPDWQIVLLGPVAKIDPTTIPPRRNIHRLGLKPYAQLPAYLSGWDVGWMPFARNEATAHISPTKTLEYLAAGLPVVSTGIVDVVEPYGRLELARIADDTDATIAAIDRALDEPIAEHRQRGDLFLSTRSWDRTWAEMAALVRDRFGRIPAAPTGFRDRGRRRRSNGAAAAVRASVVAHSGLVDTD